MGQNKKQCIMYGLYQISQIRYHTVLPFCLDFVLALNVPCYFYVFHSVIITAIQHYYTGWPPKTEQSIFLRLCSDQHLSFYTLLYRASFPHYNNTKSIKFGWELFILWVISYGLSFSGFAISLSLIVPRNSGNRANPENDSP